MTKASRLGPGSLKIGETGAPREWAAQTTATTLTPSVEYEDNIPTLDGGELEGEATETWELGGTIFQDYDQDSLELYCYEARGTWEPFEFIPSNLGGTIWSGEVRLAAQVIGGDVKARNTADFTFTARNVAPSAMVVV